MSLLFSLLGKTFAFFAFFSLSCVFSVSLFSPSCPISLFCRLCFGWMMGFYLSLSLFISLPPSPPSVDLNKKTAYYTQALQWRSRVLSDLLFFFFSAVLFAVLAWFLFFCAHSCAACSDSQRNETRGKKNPCNDVNVPKRVREKSGTEEGGTTACCHQTDYNIYTTHTHLHIHYIHQKKEGKRERESWREETSCRKG